MQEAKKPGQFVFEPHKAEPLPSLLYAEHRRLTDKQHIAPFAGFLMPLWYSSIAAEHNAVRTAAGLFDCTHMGVLDVSGPQAAGFLNTVTTNDIDRLTAGKAQYSYILDAAGSVLDDIIIYRRSAERFMLVVNAANEPKIKAYLNALLSDKAVIDIDNPERELLFRPTIRDMKNTDTENNCRADIALQGPASIRILAALADKQTQNQIEQLAGFSFIESELAGIDCIICRTGYTGATVGFELFVHPDKAAALWNKLLEKGAACGLLPCGLGARDSLRIEAGLPLYGHELAGSFNITPFQAGYGWAVKLQKDFFIGKTPMQKAACNYDMKVARMELPGRKGIRPVRQNDAVLNAEGCCCGWILSSAKINDSQIALALVDSDIAEEDSPVGMYYLARSQAHIEQGRKQTAGKREMLAPDITGKVITRFAKF